MLDAMIRRVAVSISDIGLAVLHAISLLKTLWFVAAFAAMVIYWGVFVNKATPPMPPAGPGQYVPPAPPAPQANPTPSPSAGAATPPAPPVILPPQPQRQVPAPVVPGVAMPQFNGRAPPPSPKPLQDEPFGVVRGYKPPLSKPFSSTY